MTEHLPAGVRQHDTHEELVGQADAQAAPFPARALDAIIVPASRPADHLDHALTLAQAARCRLVVLCSRQARAEEVCERFATRSFAGAVAIDLPPDYGHRWLEFATSSPRKIGGLPEPCATRDSDLSTKRNLGLILARMLGWQGVFFMDDDIRDVDARDLHRTVGMLGPQYHAAGMRVSEFPDNSVVCHAHRATGKFQDILVSGSALAVDCTAPISFFPDVYNEDWLFFYDDAAGRRLGSSGREVTQLGYDPFDDPQRATRQEFGDVLAEGLYSLLHRGRNTAYANHDYWINFLEARKAFLDAIIARADRAEAGLREKLLASVRAARQCSAEIEPEFCEHYVRLWSKDRGRWEQTLTEIPRLPSVAKALSELGLAPAACPALGDNDHGSAARTAVPAAGAAAPPAPVLVPSAATLTDQPEDSADLARLEDLANTDQMGRLQETNPPPVSLGPAVPESQRRKLASAPVEQGKKLAAMGKMVGVLVVAGVLVAFNGVCLVLGTGGGAPQNRPGRHRRTPGGPRRWRPTFRASSGSS